MTDQPTNTPDGTRPPLDPTASDALSGTFSDPTADALSTPAADAVPDAVPDAPAVVTDAVDTAADTAADPADTAASTTMPPPTSPAAPSAPMAPPAAPAVAPAAVSFMDRIPDGVKRIGGLVLVALAFFAFRTFTADDGSHGIEVGQCIAAKGTDDFNKVDCTSADSIGKVTFVQKDTSTAEDAALAFCAQHGGDSAFAAAKTDGGNGTLVCVESK